MLRNSENLTPEELEAIREAKRQYNREYYKKNKKRLRQYHNNWRKENPERVARSNKRYWLKQNEQAAK